MTKDELIFLIERYGYARRDGEHQGFQSAAWLGAIRHGLIAYELACLDALEGQAGRLYKRMSVLEAQMRCRGVSLQEIDGPLAFGDKEDTMTEPTSEARETG